MFISQSLVWFVWLIASIFYAYQYLLRVMPNIMLVDLMQQFNIDTTIFGQFSGIYYIGYSLMHLPIGIMLDRYGPRKVMTGCILLTVIGLLPIIFAKQWMYPILGRALIGIGSSAAILGVFKIIRMTFTEQRFTRMLSFSVTIGLAGAIYGGGPVSYMCALWGYKAVVQLFAAIGLVLACITYFIVPDIKSNHKATILADIKAVFTNRKVLLVCFSAGMMVGPLEGFADVWGSQFLKHIYGFETTTANYLPSIIFVGMCFGAPVLSLIAEKTGYYLGTIIGAACAMFIIFTLLVTGGLTIESITIDFILVGIGCSYQILAIYKASTYVSENIAGLTTAVANMIIMSFGYAFHSIIGFIIHAYGGPEVHQSFAYGISVIPITLFLGMMGFLALGFLDRITFRKLSVNANKSII
ncbi:MFS transporter [Legionella oakridgensis]|nr:MFS transporter [Legionella oakridgensis]ETO92079.1 arabinose efflux permease [Legionella oakridgensis RV-2-2007]KTD38434.1 major facilitator family transporter [Legionella oakridgensis]STY21349.1 major facilitator family transporter [Legionella longbeachae]